MDHGNDNDDDQQQPQQVFVLFLRVLDKAYTKIYAFCSPTSLLSLLSPKQLCHVMGKPISIDDVSILLRIHQACRAELAVGVVTGVAVTGEKLAYQIEFIKILLSAFFNCMLKAGFIRRVEGYYVRRNDNANSYENDAVYTTTCEGCDCLKREACAGAAIFHGYRVVHADDRGRIPIYFSYTTSLSVEHATAVTLVQAEKLTHLCSEVSTFINTLHSSSTSSEEEQVWLLNIQGDMLMHQHRLVKNSTIMIDKEEICQNEEARQGILLTQAETCYSTAMQLARQNLFPCHPYRLDLAINYSILLCESGQKDRGLQLLRSSFDEALAELDHSCCHDEIREVTLQLSVLYGSCNRLREHAD
jgi:hypothetical protein